MSVQDLCFIDCETTGLDPRTHVPWEIALIYWEPEGLSGKWCEEVFFIELTDDERRIASPSALQIGRYYERGIRSSSRATRSTLAMALAMRTANKHLVANNPAFDARFVGDFMTKNGWPPTWNYHLIDVTAMAAAVLKVEPPYKSRDLAEELGLEARGGDDHTAMADARWAKDMYYAVYERSPYGA